MDYDAYLLTLYRSSCETPYEEFAQKIFELTSSVLAFDSARFMAVEVLPESARSRSAVLHNEPDSINLDWEHISRLDTVLQTVTDRPNATFRFNARTLYAARDKSIVLDYAQRYHHCNGAVIASLNPETGYWDGLSLFRAGDSQHFSARDGQLLERLAPHFRQALEISRLAGGRPSPVSPVIAIVHDDGRLNYCTEHFAAIVKQAYPLWRGGKLPSELVQLVAAPGNYRLGRNMPLIAARRQGGLTYLYPLAGAALARLTRRELAVAALYSEGNSYKEVARRIQLAPATVRNVIQHVYEKLAIRDKTQLAHALGGELKS